MWRFIGAVSFIFMCLGLALFFRAKLGNMGPDGQQMAQFLIWTGIVGILFSVPKYKK